MLSEDGIAVVEFQYLADLVAGCWFDRVYHEHRFFYSLNSFSRLAAEACLSVREVTRTPFDGGSLRVVLTSPRKAPPKVVAALHAEAWLRRPAAWDGLQARAEYAWLRIHEALDAEHAESRVVAGYAASAKACTLLNWCGFGLSDLPWVTDTTPGKQGRHIPGARIPIRGEDGDWPDTYLLLAANHLPSVLQRLPANWREAGGRVITPLPLPVVI